MAKSILPKLNRLKVDKSMPMLASYAEQSIQVIEWFHNLLLSI